MRDGKTMVGTFKKNYITRFTVSFLIFLPALVLSLSKNIFERSKIPFDRLRASAGKRLLFNKKCCVILFCILIATAIIAGNDEEFFLRGNKAYTQKKYDDACNAYEMVSKKGSAVLYNMGNCYFHKGDYAQALVYWTRAEIGATPQEYNLIVRNKKHVSDLLDKEIPLSAQQKIFSFLQTLLPYISLLFLQLLFLLCWYMCLFLLRKQKIKLKKTIVSCVSIAMIFCGSLLHVHYLQQAKHEGVVVKKDAQLLVGPDKGFQALCPLMYAHNVAVKEKRDGWYKIQYADMIGWVEADMVQII